MLRKNLNINAIETYTYMMEWMMAGEIRHATLEEYLVGVLSCYIYVWQAIKKN